MRRLIFDSYAILAWLRREPQAPFVVSLWRELAQGRQWAGICLVNWGEIYYLMARRSNLATADDTMRKLAELPWEICGVDESLTLAAARFKARLRLSYTDAFALACAQGQQAELVTGDPELIAADHGVPILWPGVGDTPKE